MAPRKPGMGWAEHDKRRKAALPAAIGTPCPRCGAILTKQQGRRYRPTDAEYDHSLPRALGGQRADRFLCARCNRALGAILRNSRRARRARLIRLVTTRQW